MLSFEFGVTRQSPTDLEVLQQKTRSLFTKYVHHHLTDAAERLILPRKERSKGLLDIEHLYYIQIKRLRKYYHRNL